MDQQEIWVCTDCTFENVISRPGCEMCSAAKPDENNTGELYDHMVHVENGDLVPNSEALECDICFAPVGIGEGVKLRECLHSHCKDCLAGHIGATTNPEVVCPYQGDYSCRAILQEREIRALVTPDVLASLLNRGIRLAQSQSADSFNCLTPNCEGWCYYAPNVRHYDCPLCKKRNCLRCKAIHQSKTCEQYRQEISNNENAEANAKYFEDLIKSNKAMRCPGCDVVVQKQTGCDYICCAMCKMQMCWITKQRRWGPKGEGDWSMGCQCRKDGGPRCHPDCHWCTPGEVLRDDQKAKVQ